jgi:hypothetical protein
MLDEQLLNKVKSLIAARDRIDRELEGIFRGVVPRGRGRPRKDQTRGTHTGTSYTESWSEGTSFGSSEGGGEGDDADLNKPPRNPPPELGNGADPDQNSETTESR